MIMSQTGHRSADMVTRYIREVSLFQSNPARMVGLWWLRQPTVCRPLSSSPVAGCPVRGYWRGGLVIGARVDPAVPALHQRPHNTPNGCWSGWPCPRFRAMARSFTRINGA